MTITSVNKSLITKSDVGWDLDGTNSQFLKETSSNTNRRKLDQLINAGHVPVSATTRAKKFADQATATQKKLKDTDAILQQIMDNLVAIGLPDTTNDFTIDATTGALTIKNNTSVLALNRLSLGDSEPATGYPFTVYPEWWGAVADDTSVDSGPAINSAISFLQNTGGRIMFTAGIYYIDEQLVLRNGVSFQGTLMGFRIGTDMTGSFIHAGPNFPTSTYMITNLVTGATPSDDQFNIEIKDIGIRGERLTAETNVEGGIKFTNIRSAVIERCFLEEFLKEAILMQDSTSNITQLKDLIVFNAVTDTGLAADTGSITLDGPFDNWIVNVETGTSSAGVDVEGGKRIALLLKGNTANNFIFGGQYEFSEVGIKLESGSGRNQFTNVRADKNTRHGFWINSGGNVFSSCQALNNSFETANTYSGFRVEGTNNNFVGCIAISNTSSHNYGFHDLSSTIGGNKFRGCSSTGHGTAEYLEDNDVFSWERDPHIQRTQTTQDATPSIDKTRTLVLVSGVTTRDEITNLDDTERGQIVSLVSNAGNQFFPYIKPSSTFRLAKPFYPMDNNDCIHLQNSGTSGTPFWNEMGRSDQGMIHSAKCFFDASLTINSVDRQTVGSHQIGVLPDNSVIISAIVNVITVPTSGGSATIAFGVDTDDATGIVPATAIASYTSGFHLASFVTPLRGDSTTWTTKSTGVRDIICTIGTAALTNATRIDLWIEYVQDSS